MKLRPYEIPCKLASDEENETFRRYFNNLREKNKDSESFFQNFGNTRFISETSAKLPNKYSFEVSEKGIKIKKSGKHSVGIFELEGAVNKAFLNVLVALDEYKGQKLVDVNKGFGPGSWAAVVNKNKIGPSTLVYFKKQEGDFTVYFNSFIFIDPKSENLEKFEKQVYGELTYWNFINKDKNEIQGPSYI